MSWGLVGAMEQCPGDNGHYKYFCRMNELPLEAEMIRTVSRLFPALKDFSSQTLTWANPEAQTGQSTQPQVKWQEPTRQKDGEVYCTQPRKGQH